MANLWTLAQVFHRSAREHPGHTMVVAGGNKQSYAQVDARSSALAAAMSELGLGAGDRVAIILPNRPEWIVTLLACAKLGATVVPVNPRLNYHELKYQLRHAEVICAGGQRRAGTNHPTRLAQKAAFEQLGRIDSGDRQIAALGNFGKQTLMLLAVTGERHA